MSFLCEFECNSIWATFVDEDETSCIGCCKKINKGKYAIAFRYGNSYTVESPHFTHGLVLALTEHINRHTCVHRVVPSQK